MRSLLLPCLLQPPPEEFLGNLEIGPLLRRLLLLQPPPRQKWIRSSSSGYRQNHPRSRSSGQFKHLLLCSSAEDDDDVGPLHSCSNFAMETLRRFFLSPPHWPHSFIIRTSPMRQSGTTDWVSSEGACKKRE